MGLISVTLFSAFIMIAFVHIASELMLDLGKKQYNSFSAITKPLLMPILALYYLFTAIQIYPLIVVALIFGFLGDVFLLVQRFSKHKRFFYFGVGAFGIGHISYSLTFLLLTPFSQLDWWAFLLLLPFIITGVIFYMLLIPNIQHLSLKLIVTAYIVITVLLGICSSLFLAADFTFTLGLVYLGTLFFAISDGFNGYARFVKDFNYKGALIMLTYILAQFLIVFGMLTVSNVL